MSETPMTNLPRATTLADHAHTGDDHIALDYDARFVRRKRLVSAAGRAFLVDLPETVSVGHGMAFVLDDGSRVEIRAAREPLMEITGPALVRLAWHIGNRHTPCQIEAQRLLIRRDLVLAGMLAGLGAQVREVEAPFTPEGGAYGLGRTLGHSHGPDDAGHDHSHG